MGQRLELNEILLSFVEDDNHLYFQPPESVAMQYPCIRYEQDDVKTEYADNLPHLHTKRYQVTVIDLDPDSVIPDKVAALPMSSFDRRYVADNLNHYVYTLYF